MFSYPCTLGLSGTCIAKGMAVVNENGIGDFRFKNEVDNLKGLNVRNGIFAPLHDAEHNLVGVV